MNIIDILKYAKVAWTDKGAVEKIVAQAKTLEGPKPSYQTGEFWVNVVAPTVAGMVGGAAAVFTAPTLVPYFVIATTIIALGSYLGRTWLKGQHLIANNSLNLTDPSTMAQIATVVQNVTAAVSAIKEAKAGNTDPAKGITEQLNAPDVTVNVNPA